jgi:hypothetical protein
MHYLNGGRSLARVAARRLCPPSSPSQTLSLFVGDVIICAVLAVLSAVPIPPPTRKAGRPAAGAQIITIRAYRQDRVRPISPRCSYGSSPLHLISKITLLIFGELASLGSSKNQQGANNDVHNVCRSKAKIRARRKPIYDLVKATGAEEKQNEATKQDDDTK